MTMVKNGISKHFNYYQKDLIEYLKHPLKYERTRGKPVDEGHNQIPELYVDRTCVLGICTQLCPFTFPNILSHVNQVFKTI
jgi:hypothetical protein